MDRLAAWQALATPEGAALLERLGRREEAPPASDISRLRADHAPDMVAAAIELSLARARAAVKFGDAAARLWADRPGVEMASSPAVATWKADRFHRVGAHSIDDLCCGIGGDLMALSAVAPTVGADLDPVRAWMAGRNSGAPARVADVTTDPGRASHAHVDPARRSGSGTRAWRGDDLEPPLSAVAAMVAPRRGAAVKLGPGFDLEAGALGDAVEREFIAEGWQLVQQVAWTGDLAVDPGCTRATRVDLGCSRAGTPQDRLPAATRAGRALFVPHPALERARLVAHACADLGAGELAPGLGILTGDRCTLPDGHAPWFKAWDVLESMPARERDVARWVAARGGGIVTVHTRGGACDPDRWQAALRGPGHSPMDVFVLREGSALRAYAVRRIGPE
ncbi:MAG: hypothetical protein FGM39_07185 [Phycisphaerales bacterium]|nr:hypothetical protein [Phycisphaerales bacterium]